jgi:tetratricopeptide (TPR) repeat protein
MKLKALIITLSILIGIMSFASGNNGLIIPQDDGSKYGKDSVSCVMNLSLYREFYKQWKQSKYKNSSIVDAMKSWRKVFAYCPRATENIYVDGVKMVSYKIKKEKDAAIKDKLIDTLMMIYDQRIKYFPYKHRTKNKIQEGAILGRKGVDYYKFDPAKNYLETNKILGKAIDIDHGNAKGPVYVYYFRTIIKMAQKGDSDTAAVVDAYDMISDYIDANINKYEKLQKTKSTEEWLNIKGNIENTFEPFANCTDLVRIYQKKYDANPEDIDLLKKITKLLDKKNCHESELYFKTTVSLYDLSPSPESAYLIGKMMLKEGRYNKAIPYLKEAIKMENIDKAYKATIFLAENYQSLNQFQKARTIALNAAKLKPTEGKPYIIIGDMYAASARDCGNDDLTKKVAYWAAVDKYKKARSVEPDLSALIAKRISSYQKYFPPTELLFFHNLNEGDSYKVECWINETTTVRPAK